MKELQSIRVMSAEEIKNIRLKLNLSQSEFAKCYGLPIGTIRNWEQSRTSPDFASNYFLYQILKEPKKTAKLVKEWIEKSKDSYFIIS